MGIDLEKIRNRKRTLDNRGNGSNGVTFWRPTDGEHVIRVVPTPDGDPFKDYWFHYNVGNNSGFLSPKKNFGEDDPLDGFVRKLFGEGTEESRNLAKQLMAKQRFFTPIIVRGEESRGVQVWGFGKTVYEKLLNLVLNPEYGDITDPDAGTDLTLRYGKPPGAQFPQTEITPRRRSSTMCNDQLSEEECARLLDSVPDMSGLFERKPPEDVGKMLDEYLSDDQTAEENSSETAQYGAVVESTGDSVEKAFSELLGT